MLTSRKGYRVAIKFEENGPGSYSSPFMQFELQTADEGQVERLPIQRSPAGLFETMRWLAPSDYRLHASTFDDLRGDLQFTVVAAPDGEQVFTLTLEP